jgi:PAS domain-containing protein
VDALTDHAIFMLDERGRIASWSSGAELMTGFAAVDVIGQPSSYLYPLEDVRAGKHGAVLHVAALHGNIQDDGLELTRSGGHPGSARWA